ncbi:MAG: DUF4358 domain-containing protein [Eubacteriales bacterium]|nr:DUF4358 domain-containing protein [Eubacteriales bacterium]
MSLKYTILKPIRAFRSIGVLIGIMIIFASLQFTLLQGCAGPSDPMSFNPPVSEIAAAVSAAGGYGGMVPLDGKMLERLFNVSSDSIDSFEAQIANVNIKAEEFAVIKLKSVSDAESVSEKLEMRISSQSESFKDYLPQEYYLISKHILKTKGMYVFYAVAQDPSAAEKAFDSFFED